MVCLRPALGNAQNSPPSFIVPASIDIQHYDNDNDLLTAGKKWSDFPDEANARLDDPPTRDQLRKLAIWRNTKAIVSVDDRQGFEQVWRFRPCPRD